MKDWNNPMGEANGSKKKNEIGGSGGPTTIKIKISHGSNWLDLTVPSQSTFGDLKRIIAQEIGLEPKNQRLFFRGIEKEDEVDLSMAGVKNNAKLLLRESEAVKEVVEEVKPPQISRGCEAVAEVRVEDDKLAEQVDTLKTRFCDGTNVAEKELRFLVEMLERQLLKLDKIEAEEEGKVKRKMEVRRVQSLLDIVDELKKRNSPAHTKDNDIVLPPANCEPSEPDGGTVSGQQPSTSSPTNVTEDWELFD